MQLGLVLTNDWELYGDGSGDYFALQHRPLQALLHAVEQHGARLTVMAEVGQQWAHRAAGATHAWARDIADAWDALLQETVARQSDVQLHLHPQWLNARWDGVGARGHWQLDFDRWSVGALPRPLLRATLIARQAGSWSDLLRPVDPAYDCVAFRAGAHCIQPSGAVIGELVHAGFRCDTSVSKGLRRRRGTTTATRMRTCGRGSWCRTCGTPPSAPTGSCSSCRSTHGPRWTRRWCASCSRLRCTIAWRSACR